MYPFFVLVVYDGFGFVKAGPETGFISTSMWAVLIRRMNLLRIL